MMMTVNRLPAIRHGCLKNYENNSNIIDQSLQTIIPQVYLHICNVSHIMNDKYAKYIPQFSIKLYQN